MLLDPLLEMLLYNLEMLLVQMLLHLYNLYNLEMLLDPLKIFQNLFVQMFDIIFTANQNFHNTFPMGKPYKYSVHYSSFPNL